ncbi:MAG: hypothetical protein JXA72_12720 [Bacteroidales bacterium]|nr:hypothetical protein [Bacteroidales bacterium]
MNNSERNRLKGLIMVLLLSCTFLIIFYFKVIFSLNTTFFALGGDGILCYQNSYYLAAYDSSLMYSQSINYPYGEVSFYTQAQPLVTGVVRFVSDHFADVTSYTTGIINFLMLISIVLAAVFLYLLLSGTGLPAVYAALVSLGIAFLSPQIDRFGGHFTLGYVCAIPMLLYFMFQVHCGRNKIIFSALTGLSLFILITGHVYFLFFFAIMIGFYWLFVFFSTRKKNGRFYLGILLHITLELLLPVLIFYLLIHDYDSMAPDRPAKPYGFLIYKASPESVFIPGWDFGSCKLFHHLRNYCYADWEGVSYVGLVGVVGFVIIIVSRVQKVFRGKWEDFFKVTNNTFLNAMFWASFIALLYSFGLPFILGLEFLVEYLGPLQQIRSIGRFAWLFYFMLNTVVFYNLWQYYVSHNKSHMRLLIVALPLIMLFTDMYLFIRRKQESLNNTFPAWSDYSNINPENKWVSRIDPDKYGALIPLPFYHMGSDNYGIPVRGEMLANSFLVSMKTGLPVAAVYMSRASVSQSLKNIALVLEPYRFPEILNDMPNQKPFLIVAGKCDSYTTDELNLLNHSTKIDSNNIFDLYRLDFEKLSDIAEMRAEEICNEFYIKGFTKPDTNYIDHSCGQVIVTDFNTQISPGYQGNAKKITGRSYEVLYDGPLVSQHDSDFICSLWMSPMNRDLFPKARIISELFDSTGTLYDYKNMMAGNLIRTIDGEWGLIEWSVPVKKNGCRLKISIENSEIKRNQTYLADELLIRPNNCNVYRIHNGAFIKNCRWYQLRSDNNAIMEVPGNQPGNR